MKKISPQKMFLFLFSICSNQIRKPHGPESALDSRSTRVLTRGGFKVWSVPSRARKQSSPVSGTQNPSCGGQARSVGKRPDPNSFIYVLRLSPAFLGMPFEVCQCVLVPRFASVTVDCG